MVNDANNREEPSIEGGERTKRARTENQAPPTPPDPPKDADPKSIPVGMLAMGFLWIGLSVFGLVILPEITKVAVVFTFVFAFLFFRAAYKTRRWGRESATPSDDVH